MKLPQIYCIILVWLVLSKVGRAEINQNRPPFSLTMAQVETWTPESKWADSNNVSHVSLQPRFVAQLSLSESKLDSKVKVLIAPDGMNNLANYIGEQQKFNLYNFTHWSHIDVLNWFAGTANETVSLPARPWVETAHRNGVKVIGTVYLSVAQYGGDVATVERLLQQDAEGNFIIADKLVAIAQYYGFDGWLINPETDLTRVKNAKGEVLTEQFEYQNAAMLGKKMQHFMEYLTQKAPNGMEIHWYDSMLLNGSVRWQNELNAKNSPFFQEKHRRMSDAMFINYWWDQQMVNDSHQQAKALNRSPYQLYFGADLSPARNAQRIFERSDWLTALFPENGEKGLSSIALFASAVNYNFSGNSNTPALSNFKTNKQDYRRFYRAETQLFAGLDGNLAQQDLDDQWPGIGQYVPAKSPLTSLPFATSFNTGHGLFKASAGVKTQGEWHDVSQQDILPTWQFAIDGSDAVSVFYDFTQAFSGGNSLALRANSNVEYASIPLYQTAFTLRHEHQLSVSFKHNVATPALWLWLEISEHGKIKFPLSSEDNNWHTTNIDLSAYQGKVIEKVGLLIHGHNSGEFSANLGEMAID
ncbi:hypothetical protein tinsulaeT_07000 [Thalassotalea insulae]|uniref:Cytosolic endo-beta-N-acetylglucosaminidase TIM barrel domain-containing protein n=1 Tax=Thalassotalea insulae TaxID=2056778 RepID=A0ABQ6GRQ0_9GAMM|nr:glycoside hydrolase [Thalassotalea insulae]GLX77360.1 hypothetical protein tinsulaeT_07000 [Thalassotalea insulae]